MIDGSAANLFFYDIILFVITLFIHSMEWQRLGE
jgi:hypothetical protein